MMLSYLFLLIFGWFHPLHISISEIVLNPKNGNVEISHRIFLDDLTDDLKERIGRPLELTDKKDAEMMQELVGDYLQQHFRLELNGKPARLQYLGYEVEDDVVWAYMEVPKVRKVSSINVRNTLFFRRFVDQMNLINVTVGEDLQSLRLDRSQDNGTLTFK